MWSRTAKMPTFTTIFTFGSFCFALLRPAARYSVLLPPTSYHFCPHDKLYLPLVKRKHAFFQNFSKKLSRICGKFPVIFAATACGFGFRLLQPLVVGFCLSFCPVAESPIHSSLLLWYSIWDFGSLNVQRSLHHGMGYPSTRRDRPQL